MQKDLSYTALQDYATSMSTQESSLLHSLRQETTSLPGGQMISSTLSGRSLALLSCLLRPKTIVEIGTYTGYSALCLAEGLQKGGILYTLEQNATIVQVARRYAEAAGKASCIQFIIGDAKKTLPTLPGPFELVFIDADKKGYEQYYELAIAQLAPGGIIIADNLFWKGKVLDPHQAENDPRTKALVHFAKKTQQDPRVDMITLPIGDGLLVARKH